MVGLRQQVIDGSAVFVLYVEFEAIEPPEARQHVLCIHLNLSVGDISGTAIDFIHDALHIVAFALALAPLLQFQREVAIRRRLLEVVRVAGDERVDTDLGNVLDALLHLLQDMVRLLETTARRCLDVDEYGTHILVGHKAGLRSLHHPTETHDGNQHEDDG